MQKIKPINILVLLCIITTIIFIYVYISKYTNFIS